ncbi:MAG: hypothetical protein ACPGVE_06755 [Flavobacteriales bacterium]
MSTQHFFLALGLSLSFWNCDSDSGIKPEAQPTEQSEKNTENQTVETNKLKSIKGNTVVFYNVENLFDIYDDPKTFDDDFTPNGKLQWTAERYNTKLNRLTEVFEKIPGDLPVIIGMAEVENRDVLEDLISKTNLKSGHYTISHQESPDQRGIDVALIYRADYLKKLNTEALEVNLGNSRPTRDILYTEFQLADNQKLHTFVNHWPSRRSGQEASEHKRLAAAKVLRKKIDQIQSEDPDAQIVMMGDFNDYPTNKSITEVLDAGSSASNQFYNLALEMHQNADQTKRASHSYKGDWGMLDQMMVSQNLISDAKTSFQVKPKQFDVFYESFLLFQHPKYKTFQPNRTYAGPRYVNGYSDHLAIYLKL